MNGKQLLGAIERNSHELRFIRIKPNGPILKLIVPYILLPHHYTSTSSKPFVYAIYMILTGAKSYPYCSNFCTSSSVVNTVCVLRNWFHSMGS